MIESIGRRSKLEYPPEIEFRSGVRRVTDRHLFRKGVSYLNKGDLTTASENAIYLAGRIQLVFEGPVWIDQDIAEIVESEVKKNEEVDVRSVYLWLDMMQRAKI